MDAESGKPSQVSLFSQVVSQTCITPEVEDYDYDGSGTEDDPYVVVWIDDDPRNPMTYRNSRKWFITALVAMDTTAVSFASSAYSGGAKEVLLEFKCSQELFTLGLSLYILGFAVGPLLWAPLSELFGRQIIFAVTLAAHTIFNIGAAGSQNIWTLIILRFLAGAFGSSPLTNAGGVIADMFSARERGLPTALFVSGPFLGPTLGPIVGGFTGQAIGWRWVQQVVAFFTGALWIATSVLVPETYAPVILKKRAAELSKKTGKVYKSRNEIQQGPTKFSNVFKTSLSRPWALLIREPIVILFSLYMAILYGTLFSTFESFSIIYEEGRGWNAGVSGLAFLGVAVGSAVALVCAAYDSKRYVKISDKYGGFAPPEARLPVTMLGSIAIPVGLFWFAWTNAPEVHWSVSIIATGFFGFGNVIIFIGALNYLIDAYTIFAASALAANTVIRCLFGAAFPLFTTQMYENLGIHWATCIPAFLGLACVPIPFMFYKYGPAIREHCKFAAESKAFMERMQQQKEKAESGDGEESSGYNTENVSEEDRNDDDVSVTGDHAPKRPYMNHSDDRSTSTRSASTRMTTYAPRRPYRSHLHDREGGRGQILILSPKRGYDMPDIVESSEEPSPPFSPKRPHTVEVAGQPANEEQIPTLTPIRTQGMVRRHLPVLNYDLSPWDMDRVNTRFFFESMKREENRKRRKSKGRL